MTSYNVYVAPPDNPPLSEISDLPAYLETKEFTGSTPPPTISASMTLSGRLVGLSLPNAVFEAEEEISEKATVLLEEMRRTAQRSTLDLLREEGGTR